MSSAHAPPTAAAPSIESEEELDDLYIWVDSIPLSRPKRNIARDFSDGVLIAEVVCNYFPKLVDLHNYEAANSTQKKMYNWNTLNQKVLKKIGLQLHPQDIKDVTSAKPMSIEKILKLLKDFLPQARQRFGDLGKTSTVRADTPNTGVANPMSSSNGFNSTHASGFHKPQHHLSLKNSYQPDFPNEGGGVVARPLASYETELIEERDRTIEDLKDTILRLQEKNARLEQLVKIKDSRIDALMQRLAAADVPTR